MKKVLLNVLLTLSLYFLLNLGANYYSQLAFEEQREIYNKLELSEKLCRKYKDYNNHTAKTLVFCDSTKIIWTLEDSPFYDYVQINDYVKKDSGTMNINLARGDLDTMFTLTIVKESEGHKKLRSRWF